MDHIDTKIQALISAGPVTGDDIAYALALKGYSQARVARECGVKPPVVCTVIHGSDTSYNVASYIAALLNQPMNRLWPDGRYSRAPRERRVAA